MLDLDTTFKTEFVMQQKQKWFMGESGRLAGEVRSAGPGGGTMTYVTVFEAG